MRRNAIMKSVKIALQGKEHIGPQPERLSPYFELYFI